MYKNIKLFKGILPNEMQPMLSCISAYEKSYKKNSYIILAGDKVENFGVVVEGAVNIIKENVYGDRRLITTIEKNAIFAESFVAAHLDEAPVSVVAKEDCQILFIPLGNALMTCSASCSFHNRLIHNLVGMLANKNIMLNQKLDYLTAKTTRERIAKYFIDCANIQGKTTITIPYNRNELSEYLGVDRSVLSRELSKLKQEGILEFNKNTFHISEPKTLGKYYS